MIDRVDVSHFRLSMHLFIAFLILSLILWNYFNLKKINLPNNKINFFIPIIFLILLFLQIIIGAFVSGMDAGKIYNSWPLMDGSYFPDDSQIQNLIKFTVFTDPSLVQFIHRNLAYIIFLFFLFIFFQIYKNKIKKLYFITFLLGIFLTIQIFLGILTLIYGAHIYLASMHQISSIFLVSSSVYFLYLNSKNNLQISN